jgi:hypothetical protein
MTYGSDKPLTVEPDRMVRLRDVLDVIEECSAAPDGYYYANQKERIIGWEMAAVRIRMKMEELADDGE